MAGNPINMSISRTEPLYIDLAPAVKLNLFDTIRFLAVIINNFNAVARF
jgi:hypothetical protein